uniref:NADH-ubiquinone oxidoreductase chain 6 n=1 Tax=Cambarus robustus TaxID=1240928 RepID=A0A1L6V0H0_9EUCA|nr:NADH dehydrogenase subunit 6 [Cambarus robustus]APS87268.1 NADH dehydrogenase subunit 6 [Cambarus robustus]UZC55681.1 NADH dehydrogenase subunit 6 [Cambarus robustus]
MLIFLLPLTLLISILFTRLTHPLSMGLTLLTQTLIICISSGLSNNSLWFSYILFLIFLGGMLVLFIYVASLASNEMFEVSPNTMPLLALLMISVSSLLFFIDPLLIYSKYSMSSSSLLFPYKFSNTPFLISTIYNFSSMLFTLFIIMYLLLTLFAVVKIINVYSSPLRTNN